MLRQSRVTGVIATASASAKRSIPVVQVHLLLLIKADMPHGIRDSKMIWHCLPPLPADNGSGELARSDRRVIGVLKPDIF